MDPWLESPSVFPDFHNRFISLLSESLNLLLPSPYFTAIGTRVLIEGETDGIIEPDVDVLTPADESTNGYGHRGNGGGVAVAEPANEEIVVVRVPQEETTEWQLDVRTTDGNDRLVTSIEMLSPANKRLGSRSRELYLHKQRELIERGVHLIEIDWLRAGQHTTAVALRPARQQTGGFVYHICVTRAGRFSDFDVYPIQLSRPLPTLRVPLLPGTDDLRVPLQPIFDRCYDVGLYARRLRYQEPPDPPLTSDHQTWATAILQPPSRST
jgi:hypothetical protein